ncbi:MAG TPA: hypothetical protein VN442_04390 [Bryobacteraceae bacterium]|nr:hypothetical protein [Bryobacteraceae bacterium]
MFDSLSDQIKHDALEEPTSAERIVRWVMVAVFSVLLFGGLYFGVRLLE